MPQWSGSVELGFDGSSGRYQDLRLIEAGVREGEAKGSVHIYHRRYCIWDKSYIGWGPTMFQI